MSKLPTYRRAEDPYPDHRCQCTHLDVQHNEEGCPWCNCMEYRPWKDETDERS